MSGSSLSWCLDLHLGPSSVERERGIDLRDEVGPRLRARGQPGEMRLKRTAPHYLASKELLG
jgi:hypothetical protein